MYVQIADISINYSHLTLVQVKSQLSKAFEPALTSVEVVWQQFDDNTPKPIQVCVIGNHWWVNISNPHQRLFRLFWDKPKQNPL